MNNEMTTDLLTQFPNINRNRKKSGNPRRLRKGCRQIVKPRGAAECRIDAASRDHKNGLMRLESIPEPRCPKYPSLDIWRGVACLKVVIYHSTYFACRDAEAANDAGSSIIAATGHLWVGVPIFFVISGYCISATADSSRRRRNSAKSYFLRRFRRIYPPYWAAALVYLAFILAAAPMTDRKTSGHVNWGIPSPFEFSVSQLIGNTALIESWRNHVAGSPQKYFIEQSWTLCYEEQFYAVTGLILLMAPRRYFSAAALITILSIAARLFARRKANLGVSGGDSLTADKPARGFPGLKRRSQLKSSTSDFPA
jgi:hypothetical protein